MATWQYFVGHVWRYEGDDVPAGMEMRFEANEEAQAAGLCGCECGVCGPQHPHTVDEGCVCTPLACPCLDQLSDPDQDQDRSLSSPSRIRSSPKSNSSS